MAIAWYRVTIMQDTKIVRERPAYWPDDHNPKPYLNKLWKSGEPG